MEFRTRRGRNYLVGGDPVLRQRALIRGRRTRNVDILARHRNSCCYLLKRNSGRDPV
jgi:hypothetical protein